ncbi:hypothetical protein WA158_004580 [Blastocystis sp. Blastoise]
MNDENCIDIFVSLIKLINSHDIQSLNQEYMKQIESVCQLVDKKISLYSKEQFDCLLQNIQFSDSNALNLPFDSYSFFLHCLVNSHYFIDDNNERLLAIIIDSCKRYQTISAETKIYSSVFLDLLMNRIQSQNHVIQFLSILNYITSVILFENETSRSVFQNNYCCKYKLEPKTHIIMSLAKSLLQLINSLLYNGEYMKTQLKLLLQKLIILFKTNNNYIEILLWSILYTYLEESEDITIYDYNTRNNDISTKLYPIYNKKKYIHERNVLGKLLEICLENNNTKLYICQNISPHLCADLSTQMASFAIIYINTLKIILQNNFTLLDTDENDKQLMNLYDRCNHLFISPNKKLKTIVINTIQEMYDQLEGTKKSRFFSYFGLIINSS